MRQRVSVMFGIVKWVPKFSTYIFTIGSVNNVTWKLKYNMDELSKYMFWTP